MTTKTPSGYLAEERVMKDSKITDFEIQYKHGGKWVTWARDTKMGEWDRTLTPVRARYFRLVINAHYYMSGVREFQLF